MHAHTHTRTHMHTKNDNMLNAHVLHNLKEWSVSRWCYATSESQICVYQPQDCAYMQHACSVLQSCIKPVVNIQQLHRVGTFVGGWLEFTRKYGTVLVGGGGGDCHTQLDNAVHS